MLPELFNEKVLGVNSTPSGPGLGICRPSAGSAGQSEIRAEPEAVTGSLSNASPDGQSVIETTYSGSSKKASASIVACWSCWTIAALCRHQELSHTHPPAWKVPI